MRKQFLLLFYFVVSGFIIAAISQDFEQVLRTTSASEPQYVFTRVKEDNAEERAQQEAEILRKWAEDYDPKNSYQ